MSLPPEVSWPPIDTRDTDRVAAALARGEISYNADATETRALEANFRRLSGKPHCLALNSGTSALHLAFVALGLTEGDTVLAPTYTFPATVLPLLHLRAKCRLVDTAPGSPNVGSAEIERHLSSDVKAVIVVHMDGVPADVPGIRSLCDRHKIALIEDCAQGLGALYDHHNVGALADVAIYSLQQKKLVTGGEGGILATDRLDVYQIALLLGYLQRRPTEELMGTELESLAYTGLGFNLRVHPLAAALANSQFERYPEYLAARIAFAEAFFDGIADISCLARPAGPPIPHVNSFYSLKLMVKTDGCDADIDALVAALRAEGAPVLRATTKPLHQEPLFRERMRLRGGVDNEHLLVDRNATFPNAERYCGATLRLSPLGAVETARRIAQAFVKVFSQARRVAELARP